MRRDAVHQAPHAALRRPPPHRERDRLLFDFGGNLPTTPYTTDGDGRGPAWSNSLFEDNAEFGLGLRLAVDSQQRMAQGLLRSLASNVGDERVRALLEAGAGDETALARQRARVAELPGRRSSL